MDNSARYLKWFSDKGLPPILLPNMVAVDGPDETVQFVVQGVKCDDEQSKGKVRGILPFVRAYWTNPFIRERRKPRKENEESPEGSEKEANKEEKIAERETQRLKRARRNRSRPPWEPQTWMPLRRRNGEVAWLRYLRADQALDLLAWMHPPEIDLMAFKRQVRIALEGWFVSIDEMLIEQPAILTTRIDTVQFTIRPDRKCGHLLEWSRQLNGFGNDLRASLVGDVKRGKTSDDWEDVRRGLDPVHTPENTRAGLVRYLCRGWTIDENGRLADGVETWGTSTAAIRYRLHNAPRRLMLGASLQTRAVKLGREDEPPHWDGSADWYPPGRNLFAVFSTFGGWTHEDAIVISEWAAQELTSMKTRRIDLFIPRIANRIEVRELGQLKRGTPLARAFVDLYAMGYRPHEADVLAKNNHWRLDNGWLEVELPGAEVDEDAYLVSAERQLTPTSFRFRDLMTFLLEDCAPVRVGDKIATPHGIKGVVSRILPDNEMPEFEGRNADIVLSPLGIVRRGAMGQFREAAVSGTAHGLPRAGTIFVIRQPQDAGHQDRFRFAGTKSSIENARKSKNRQNGKGQRYGEMEFWALMAHGAHSIANELLSFERSTAHWMRMEAEARLDKTDQRRLATGALNRFLAMIGARVQDGRLIPPQIENGRFVVDGSESAFEFPLPQDHKRLKKSLDDLDDEKIFLNGMERGLGRITLTTPVEISFQIIKEKKKGHNVCKEYRFLVKAVSVIPPWLRPQVNGVPHDLTNAYGQLIRCLISGDERMKDRLPSAVQKCIAIAMGWRWGSKKMSGVDVFLRRELFGRRLTRSARAVIVPDPNLRIDQIGLPRKVAKMIFEGLPADRQDIVLVNRNPTLQRRGLLALRPVIDESEATVFRLPLGVLKTMAADFDGDQASVIALETDEAVREAEELLLPGCKGLRSDPFRVMKNENGSPSAEFGINEPAFPLVKEMANLEDERQLAADNQLCQEAWCDKHADLVRQRILEIGDGWSEPDLAAALDRDKIAKLWQGVDEAQWLDDAKDEMMIVYTSVRKKGHYGGVLRRQLFRRAFSDPESFRRSVEALHAVTEPLVQSALSCKSGEAFTFPIGKFFEDPSSNRSFLRNIDPIKDVAGEPVGSRFDEEVLCQALGNCVEPSNLLAWFSKPTFQTLLACLMELPSMELSRSSADPRIAWFME